MEKVHKILVEKQKWYDQTANRAQGLRPHEDPAVLCAQIKQERDVSDSHPRGIELPSFVLSDAGKRLLVDLEQTETPRRITGSRRSSTGLVE